MGEDSMVMPQTPYSSDLDEREPVGAMSETVQRLQKLVDWPSAQEPSLGGREALDALLAFAAMNRAFFSSLTPADRAVRFSHPEFGALTVDWIVHMMAGHQIHHLKQLDAIAR